MPSPRARRARRSSTSRACSPARSRRWCSPTSAPTVIKVERPGQRRRHARLGPAVRRRAARPPTSSRSTATSAASRSTSRTDDGRAAARASWPARADVVVENFRPGVMDGLGLGYDDARRREPAASSTARSPASAAARAPRCPATTCSCRRVGGLMSITGEPDGRAAEGRRRARRRDRRPLRDRRHPRRAAPPRRAPARASASRSTCSRALLAALVNQALGVHDRRRRPGAGWATRTRASRPTSCFDCGRRRARRSPSATTASSPRSARCSARRAGADPRFATNRARVANRERAARRARASGSRARTAAEWVERARGRAACRPASVNDVAGRVRARRAARARPDRRARRLKLVRNPIRLSETPPRYDSAPPALGADTEDVLGVQGSSS